MYKHLSENEWILIMRLAERIDDESADPDEIYQVIQILERERTRIIAENMRKVIDEEIHEENYD